MNKELFIYKIISNHLPYIPKITGLVNRVFKAIYFRSEERKKERYIVDVLDNKMELEPYECVDGGLFFYPHIYDKEEFSFLRNVLYEGDIFFDIGANIGIYTILASRLVSDKGIVVSIEADPYNYKKLIKNIKLNNLNNIVTLNIGVSDKSELLKLGINKTGNRGGNSFTYSGNESVDVQCESLSKIVHNLDIKSIKLLKIDIEGFEYRVLKEFFENVTETLYPNYIIIEHLHSQEYENPIELLLNHRYKVIKSNKYNSFLEYINE